VFSRAVYGASEGLSVLVIRDQRARRPGGASSRIENYLGSRPESPGQDLRGGRLYKPKNSAQKSPWRDPLQALKMDGNIFSRIGAEKNSAEPHCPFVARRAANIRKPGSAESGAIEGVPSTTRGKRVSRAPGAAMRISRIVGRKIQRRPAPFSCACTLKPRVSNGHEGPASAATMSRYLFHASEACKEITLMTSTVIEDAR